ncbi:MAG: DUF6750 family protein [Pseudomonadota bacterium]
MSNVHFWLSAMRLRLDIVTRKSGQWSLRIHMVVLLALVSAVSRAQAQTRGAGVTGFFTGWKSALGAATDLILLGGLLAGVAGVLYGMVMMIKKGLGRGDDIEWRQVLWPIIGGGLATIILFVIQSVVEESGASRSDMGRTF